MNTLRTKGLLHLTVQLMYIARRSLQFGIPVLHTPEATGIPEDTPGLFDAFAHGNLMEAHARQFFGPALTFHGGDHAIVALVNFVADQYDGNVDNAVLLRGLEKVYDLLPA
jgi:hypothetical protein